MKVDLYTVPHKGLRNLVTRFAFRAGTVDWTQPAEVTQVASDWQIVRDMIDVHHRSEERYIHPLLAQAIPGGRRSFDEEHRALGVAMDDLSRHIERLLSDGAVANRPEVGLEFYRGVNRLYAMFLPHINREESEAQRALDELYPPEVLAPTLQAVVAGLPPQVLMLLIDYMFPAMTLPEAAELVAAVDLPPETLNPLLARVRQALGEVDWARLQALLAAERAPV